MSTPFWRRLRFYGSLALAAFVIVMAVVLCIYPAVVVTRTIFDSELKTTGQSRHVASWFESVSKRHSGWAAKYLESGLAAEVHHTEVAATEWPMFGAVFYLVTAETLANEDRIDATNGAVRDAIELSAEIVASPVTATWVKTKWGESYLEEENVFYRMLLIMGLSSYEAITGNKKHRALMSRQRQALAEELSEAPLHLLDDYPGECFPNDILWAVAAIKRAAALEGADHARLAQSLMQTFNRPPVAVNGLPAFQMRSELGTVVQEARGCGNSGILLFAAELDPAIAEQWYRAYVDDFWKDNGWLAGFTELPRGTDEWLMDVDSGPVVFEFGSVASAFGIGAANTFGRLDHSVPLTMQAIACAWPTPFGFLVPRIMGKIEAGSSTLGEVALLFLMTRPSSVPDVVPYDGRIPYIVWTMLLGYLAAGSIFIGLEIRGIRRTIQGYRTRTVQRE